VQSASTHPLLVVHRYKVEYPDLYATADNCPNEANRKKFNCVQVCGVPRLPGLTHLQLFGGWNMQVYSLVQTRHSMQQHITHKIVVNTVQMAAWHESHCTHAPPRRCTSARGLPLGHICDRPLVSDLVASTVGQDSLQWRLFT